MDLQNKLKKIELELSEAKKRIKKLEKDTFTLLNRHKPNTDNALTTLTVAIKKIQKDIAALKGKK